MKLTEKARRAKYQKSWIKSPAGIRYKDSKAYRDSIRKAIRKRDRESHDKLQKRVRDEKMKRGCKKCGYNKHFAALQFHHRNPKTKKFRLSECRNYSWKMVQKEMAKCDVLCSNCHAVLEYRKSKRKSI